MNEATEAKGDQRVQRMEHKESKQFCCSVESLRKSLEKCFYTK